MGSIERVTPDALMDLFSLLTNEEQVVFLKLLGRQSLAEVPLLINSEMDAVERARYAEMIHNASAHHIFPLLEEEALKAMEALPSGTHAERLAMLRASIRERMEVYDKSIGEREAAKLKDSRDRKSDAETIRRNNEIIDLRTKSPNDWSLGKIAKKYQTTWQNIQKIMQDKAKGRRLKGATK